MQYVTFLSHAGVLYNMYSSRVGRLEPARAAYFGRRKEGRKKKVEGNYFTIWTMLAHVKCMLSASNVLKLVRRRRFHGRFTTYFCLVSKSLELAFGPLPALN
jgi:hypothetical protein